MQKFMVAAAALAVGAGAAGAGAAQPTGAGQAAIFAGGNLQFDSFSTVSGGPVVANGNVAHGNNSPSGGLVVVDSLYAGGAFSHTAAAYQSVKGEVLFNGSIADLGGPGRTVGGNLTSAAGSVNFESNIKVAGSVAAAGDFSQSFPFASVAGNVRAGGNVAIAGTVAGGVTYGGTFSRGTFATIGGPIQMGGAVSPTPFAPLSTPAGSGLRSTGPDVTLASFEDRALAPGNYGTLALGSSTTVSLTAGTYIFKAIQSDFRLNRLSFDTSAGPIKVFVDGDLTLGLDQVINGESLLRSGMPNPADAKNISFEVAGNFTAASALYGSIFAPNGSITLNDFADVNGRLLAGGDVTLGDADVTVPEPASLSLLLLGGALLARRRSR